MIAADHGISSRSPQSIESFIEICSPLQIVWKAVQNVDVAGIPRNLLLSFLDIPEPVSATLYDQGVGSKRIAIFSNGKKFIQTVTEWNPPYSYTFNFEAEARFRVGYLFDLSKETFSILSGSYRLESLTNGGVRLYLESHYIFSIRFLKPIVHYLLKRYQVDLLRRIRINCENQHDENT